MKPIKNFKRVMFYKCSNCKTEYKKEDIYFAKECCAKEIYKKTGKCTECGSDMKEKSKIIYPRSITSDPNTLIFMLCKNQLCKFRINMGYLYDED